MSGVKQEGE